MKKMHLLCFADPSSARQLTDCPSKFGILAKTIGALVQVHDFLLVYITV